MPTPTYVLIDSRTVLSTATSQVTINSIPGSYRDLVLVIEGSSSNNTDYYPRLQFNSDTSTNYSFISITRSGSSFNGSNETGAQLYNSGYFQSGTSQRAIVVTHIMDYSATDRHKPMISRFAQGISHTEMVYAKWANAVNAITSIRLHSSNGATLLNGTTINLYGIVYQ